MEEWKQVLGYEGLYEVSNTGKVRSVTHYRNGANQFGATFKTIYRGRELKPHPRRKNGKYEECGHLRVSLTKQGKTKKVFIHRLVASAFVPNPKNLPIVNHIDENPQNINRGKIFILSIEEYGLPTDNMLDEVIAFNNNQIPADYNETLEQMRANNRARICLLYTSDAADE